MRGGSIVTWSPSWYLYFNLKDVQDAYDSSKRKADGLKMMYEERLTQTEDDDTGEINELKKVFAREIE